MSKKIFTLIELIVIIAVIGILATLLVPSLKKAKEASYSAVCASKLAHCGRAMIGYARDNNQFYPGVTGRGDYKDGLYLKQKGGDNSEWKITLMPYLGLKAKESNKNHQYFTCPMSKLYDLTTPNIRNKYAGGLAYNRDLGNVSASVFGGSKNYPPLIKVPQIEIPAETVAMGDTTDNPPNEKAVKCISKPSWANNYITVGNRHNKGMNVLWADLGVRWKSQNDLRSGKNGLIDYYYLMIKD